MTEFYDDRPLYQRIGYKLGSRPITMTTERPANGLPTITAHSAAPNQASEVAALNSQSGRNAIEKAMTLLASRDASFASLPHKEKVFQAGQYVRSLSTGALAPAPLPVVPMARTAASTDVGNLIEEFNATPGRNHIERMDSLLCSRDPNHVNLDKATRCRVAGEAVRTLMAGARPRGL